MRTKLKQIRIGKHMNQEEFAQFIGISRPHYSGIESGKMEGSRKLWQNIQQKLCIPDSEMWELMKNDETR